MRKQHGISLSGTIFWLGILGFVGIMAAKLLPSYVEYYSVKKMFAAMVSQNLTAGSVRDIRAAYDRMNQIEDVKAVDGKDLEITKSGGETVLTAVWAKKIPMVGNVSACLDFTVTTEK